MLVYLKPSLLGDAILTEPAMTAWSEAHGGEPVDFYFSPMNAAYACLFEHNPAIRVISSDEFDRYSTRVHVKVVPDSQSAYYEAHRLKLPFAAGYFFQFGLNPDPGKHRLHFEVFSRYLRYSQISWSGHSSNEIAICPNARSCMSSVYLGSLPNIKATVEWWEPVVDFIGSYGIKVVNIGSPDGMKIKGTDHWTGSDFRDVVRRLAGSRFVISVETGLLHLAGGIDGLPIVFLSSATPSDADDPTSYFAAPRNARIVRSKVWKRATFDRDEVIGHIKELLA